MNKQEWYSFWINRYKTRSLWSLYRSLYIENRTLSSPNNKMRHVTNTKLGALLHIISSRSYK